MVKEIKESNVYKIIDGDKILLTIGDLGGNVYKAVNKNTIIIGKIVPLDEHRTELSLIENKKADKNGRYRKTKKLADHKLSWLHSMVERAGFVRKTVPLKNY